MASGTDALHPPLPAKRASERDSQYGVDPSDETGAKWANLQ